MNEQELLKALRGLRTDWAPLGGAAENELVFDDEPIDAILYSPVSVAPTPASIFRPAQELLSKLKADSTDIRSEAALRRFVCFLDDNHPLPRELFLALTRLTASILPAWPKPLPADMPTSVGPLMERLWRLAVSRGDDDLKFSAGARLWEWYEYVARHPDARDVLSVLEEIELRRNNPKSLPGIVNNYAFQFQKERLWQEAAVHYDRAARLADELKQLADYANARANYWGCRFELEGAPICKIMVPELRRLGEMLHEAKWPTGERKVLVLLARAEAASGNPQAGVPLLEKAIAIDESQGSMYIEADRKLLRNALAIVNKTQPT